MFWRVPRGCKASLRGRPTPSSDRVCSISTFKVLKICQQKNTIVLAAAYFSRVKTQVSSALEGLTSEFWMGSGVTLPQEPPEQWCFYCFALFEFAVFAYHSQIRIMLSHYSNSRYSHTFADSHYFNQKRGKIIWFISTPQLNPLRDLHLEPIKVIVSDQPMKPNLGDGFALRCFQRLS